MLPSRAVVLAQLVERLLPTSEIQIPTSAKFYLPIVRLNRNEIEMMKTKKKRPGMAHLQEKCCHLTSY